jgi:O-antigen/teichoic acid export membrane protein
VSVLQKHERNDIVSLSTVIQGFMGLIFFVAGYLATHDLLVGIVGILLSRLLSVLFADGRLSRPFGSWGKHSLWKDLSNRDSRERYISLFRVGLPMGGVALLSTLFASIPRLVLDKSVSTEAVGFYSALSSVVVVMSLFINSLGQSFTPRLSIMYSQNKEEFSKKIGLIALVSLVFVGVCLVFSWFLGRELLTILFTSAYAHYKLAFIKLIIGGGFLVFFSIMNIAISAQRAFKIQFPIYVICALVTLISSLMMIPRIGLDGAVYSYILCNMTGFALTSVVYAANMRKSR